MSRCARVISDSTTVRPARDREGGFTLVEVMVAFIVLATVLSVLFRGVVGLRVGASAFDNRMHADLVARALLEESTSRRMPRETATSGWREGRHWSMRATPLDLTTQIPAPPPNGEFREKTASWVPQRVIIRVETGARPIEVETIQLVKAR